MMMLIRTNFFTFKHSFYSKKLFDILKSQSIILKYDRNLKKLQEFYIIHIAELCMQLPVKLEEISLIRLACVQFSEIVEFQNKI